MEIRFDRYWAMPNHKTFEIKPIKDLISQELGNNYIDPFPYPFKQDAIDYMKSFKDSSIDKLVFDPPYSAHQLKEKYHSNGIALNNKLDNSYWSKCKKEIGRIMKINGKVISFGWNTNGVGKNNGFEKKRIVIIAHGSQHNDTLATVEVKVR